MLLGRRRVTAWLELALTGIDLPTWTRTLLLDGEHAQAEPRKLRYRLLHVAAGLVRTRSPYAPAHRSHLRCADDLAAAYTRLVALSRPIG